MQHLIANSTHTITICNAGWLADELVLNNYRFIVYKSQEGLIITDIKYTMNCNEVLLNIFVADNQYGITDLKHQFFYRLRP